MTKTPGRRGVETDGTYGVRLLEERDHPAILEIFRQPLCLRAMATEPFQTTGDIRDWVASQGKDALALVAISEDVPIGIGILAPGQDYRSHVGGLVLFVHDAFHRKGIATRLLQALIATADIYRGMKRLELWVLCSNSAAIQLYQKFGFVVEGRHRSFAFRNGEMVDVYTMARIVAEPLIVAAADAQVADAPPDFRSRTA